MTRLVARRQRRARNGRLLSAAVALGMTGALVAGGFAVLGHRGNGSLGPATGTSGATGPATSAPGSSQNLVAGPGQFYYWKFAVVDGSTTAHLTYWWSPDGTGRMVTSETGDGYGVLPSGPMRIGKYPTGDDLSDLSTDPATLLGQLQDRSAPGGKSPRPVETPGPDPAAGVVISAIQDLLSQTAPHSSPSLRVAMYEVLKGIPGVQDLGAQGDPTGRAATALRVTVGGSVLTFWFDPDSHLFLAEDEATSQDATPMPTGGTSSGATTAPSGDPSHYYVIVESGGIVDSDSAVPTADQENIPEAGALPT